MRLCRVDTEHPLLIIAGQLEPLGARERMEPLTDDFWGWEGGKRWPSGSLQGKKIEFPRCLQRGACIYAWSSSSMTIINLANFFF